MPNNPLTSAELQSYINPTGVPQMPAGYFLASPVSEPGPFAYRLFDASYISLGIVDPNRLGTGATGAGNLYLADDGTWKVISGAPGIGDMLKATYDVDNDGTVDSAERIEIIVRNSTGSTLTKGTVVYLSGATGNRPNAVRAQADTEATSSKTFGIVVQDISNNSDGYVAVNGTLHDLDTSAFADGVAVWLSATVAGGITSTIPAEPNHTVFIGYIARSHPTQGRLVILIQNGYELNELHGVLISAEANNDLLVYESSSTLWKNKSISTIFGGTPLVSVPTLAQVTTAGNTTTNAITVGNLTANGTFSFLNGVSSYWLKGVQGNSGVNGNEPFLALVNNNLIANATYGWLFYDSAADGSFNLYRRNSSTTGNQVYTISRSTGNFLIGTTTDAGYKLDVNGTFRSNALWTTGSGIVQWGPQPSAYGVLTWDTGYARIHATTGNRLDLGAGGGLHMSINTSGNVGIGTTSPTYKVDVQGTTLAASSVRVQGSFDINPLAAPPAIGGFTLSAGTNLGVGVYYYFVVYVTALGETNAGSILTVTTTTGNTTVNLTGIPISPDPRVTARKLYRTKVGGTIDNQWFLATISNNTATTYTDSATDASLTGVGAQAYKVNTTARNFTVSGVQGMVIDTNLTALGRNAGAGIISSSGSAIRTVLIGTNAGQNITTGQANVIVGVTGVSVTTGGSNTLIGDLAGYIINSGSSNSIFGAQSGRFLTIGGSNLILGAFSGRYLADGTTQFTSGNNNVIIGPDIRMSTATDSNSIVIGRDARGLGTNTTVIGNSSTTFTSIPAGNMTVGGTTNAGYKLDVQGNIRSTSLTTDGPVVSNSGVLTSVAGYTGMVTIQQPSPLPPVTFDIQNGIIVSVT